MNPQNFYGRKISKTGVNVTQATDTELILKEDYDQGYTIYYDVNGNPSVLLGTRHANAVNALVTTQQGFFVSQKGINVLNATDAQLTFNSQNDTFEIVKKVPISLTYTHTNPNSEYHQTSVAHGLTYTPGFQAFNTIDSRMITYWGLTPVVSSRTNPALLTGASGGFVFNLCYVEVTVDASNVYLLVQTGGGEPTASYTFSATAYLLRETFS